LSLNIVTHERLIYLSVTDFSNKIVLLGKITQGFSTLGNSTPYMILD
jgi:hypothetical protein